jgi:pimeloyl-ACP methyl ester carboxylesterase
VEVEVSPTLHREDFPFESRFADVLDARLHYVEVGQGRPILLLHGNPTWSYVWRNILPIVAEQGRAIAVDLVGMGRSSKPEILYRFADHSAYLDAFIQALGLRNVTFVLHDWGSALGFHYACRHPDNVRAMAFFEAILAPIPGWGALPRDLRQMFQSFRDPAVGCRLIIEENMFIEKVLPAGISRTLTDREMESYREPYLKPEALAQRGPDRRSTGRRPRGGRSLQRLAEEDTDPEVAAPRASRSTDGRAGRGLVPPIATESDDGRSRPRPALPAGGPPRGHRPFDRFLVASPRLNRDRPLTSARRW